MTPIPLDQIGFRWRDHKSALWWLGMFYRQPTEIRKVTEGISLLRALRTSTFLFFHSVPYISAITILGSSIVFIAFAILGKPSYQTVMSFFTIISILAAGFAGWISVGIVPKTLPNYLASHGIDILTYGLPISGFIIGIISGRGIEDRILLGIIWAVACMALGLILALPLAAAGAMAVMLFATLTSSLGSSIVFGIIVGAVVGIHSSVTLAIISGVIAVIFYSLRLYYYPFHFLFIWPKPRVRWYPYHPFSWDDLCRIPFAMVHELLVAIAEENPEKESEIDRLISSYPSQRNQALRAKVILLSRKVGRSANLSKLDVITQQFPEGDKKYLAQTPQVRKWVGEISRLQTRLDTINRYAFREPIAELLVKEIENFRHRIAGLHEPLATEFRAAATQWLALAEHQLEEARRGATRELMPQVFRAGDPADRDSEAFAPRYGVVGELEQQIMLSTGCPGIVLYGRRRTGKSTILRNLTGFLPTEVIPVNASMQNPALFTSTEDFVGFISSEVNKQLGNLKVNDLASPDLPGLFRFLGNCNTKLEAEGKRLLLGVDEYETIDRKIGEGVFKTDLLDTVRESIQSHRRITWIFAGSHEITELVNAEWTSYLVSARTIEVPFFTPAETRLLLTDPLKHSSLWRNNPDKRPQFDPSFWGDAADNCGIERIQAEAAGWPHLVQLIAETIVDLINEEDADGVSPELMERAMNKAIVRGHNVLHTLMRGESLLPGEWDYLSAFRDVAVQAPPADRAVAKSLRRRLLIEENNSQWQLRVPLMARWLKVRGE